MFTTTKLWAIFVILFSLLAACGAQPAEPAAPSTPESEAEAPGDEAAAAEEHAAQEEEYEHLEKTQAEIERLTPLELAEGEKLNVVVTTNIVGDLVRNVGRDKLDLIVMLPIGADPHTFSPAPQDVAAVADADVIFANGLGLELFLAELIENAGGDAPLIELAGGVETRAFAVDHDEHTAQADPEHQHGDIDPHIWMTPHNVIPMVHNVAATLSALDPANAETYEARAEAYAAELQALDEWVMAQIASIPAENRKMVTDHDSFGYYAERYGLEVIGAVIPNYSTNAEPSAQELAALQDAVRAYDVQAIFVGTTVNSTLAERLATDSGIELVPLYTGSLGEAGSGIETYVDFIRYNTTAIVGALQPKP